MPRNNYPQVPDDLIEKAPEQLAHYEKLFSADDLPEHRLLALRDAIELCAWYQVPPPKWVAAAVPELCYAQIEAHRQPGRLGSYQTRLRQHRIHLIRWATVRHLRDNCRERFPTWNNAYEGASVELRATIAQGNEEVMAASYKKHSQNSYLQIIKDRGRTGRLAEIARDFFENKAFLLNVDSFSSK
jgi:hypothetical protein